jgi:hypothetical protein
MLWLPPGDYYSFSRRIDRKEEKIEIAKESLKEGLPFI